MDTQKSNLPGKHKKTYRKPALNHYGSIARLTRTAHGNQQDSGGQNFVHQAAGGGSSG